MIALFLTSLGCLKQTKEQTSTKKRTNTICLSPLYILLFRMKKMIRYLTLTAFASVAIMYSKDLAIYFNTHNYMEQITPLGITLSILHYSIDISFIAVISPENKNYYRLLLINHRL